jgi:hypothetical protein
MIGTAEQVVRYDTLRGYGGLPSSAFGMSGVMVVRAAGKLARRRPSRLANSQATSIWTSVCKRLRVLP